ncbi:MAG TPA: arsenate reductase ArsC [Acidobacteriota bacterium]|nr:arsenate reductase ArsC [Acidobacteriota bacterium]
MREAKTRLKVLFLCTGNSCRSQMAEGWARHLLPDVLEARSAGTEKRGLDPVAVKVMAERGVDISGHKSKMLAEVAGVDFDYVITVCADADANCPVFPGRTIKIHRGFDDPPALAGDAKTDEDALREYRRVRDEIRDFVKTLPELSGTVRRE